MAKADVTDTHSVAQMIRAERELVEASHQHRLHYKRIGSNTNVRFLLLCCECHYNIIAKQDYNYIYQECIMRKGKRGEEHDMTTHLMFLPTIVVLANSL